MIKGISLKRLRQEFLEEIKRFIWKDGTLWAVGYYVGSVSDKATTGLVREYIQNQKAEARKQAELVQDKLFD